jgi:hypothetical protein
VIAVSDGNNSLTLTSVKTDSDCADNVWLEPASLAVRPIPFGAGLTLSFTETGQIIDPESCDAVYIAMLFDARVMEYVLQRGTWWTDPPRGSSCTDDRFDFPGPVILLGEHDGTYCRDLRSDLLSVNIPLPLAVTDFVLEITSGGSATIDDIKFVDSASAPTCAPSPTPTPTPTATQTATTTATSKPTKTSGPGPFVCVACPPLRIRNRGADPRGACERGDHLSAGADILPTAGGARQSLPAVPRHRAHHLRGFRPDLPALVSQLWMACVARLTSVAARP